MKFEMELNHDDDPCDICGGVGFGELIVTCFQCKLAKEHCYCMREVTLTIPEIWLCEECRLSKAIASPKSVMVEDVPVSSTSTTSERVCSVPLLKLSRKSVHYRKEMASKSNPSEASSPSKFLKYQERSRHACKQMDVRIGNEKKSSGASKSDHFVSYLVSSLDKSNTLATVSETKSCATKFKAASAKLSAEKIKASYGHKRIGHSTEMSASATQQKATQTSKKLEDKKTSATCEKEPQDTSMPGEKIETSRSQQRHSEQVSREGLVSLPVDTIASTLTESDLEKIALEYHIDTNRYHLSLPKSSQRANSSFPHKHTFCFYADAFKSGLRLPLHPLIPKILHEFGLAPTQIYPNSWRVLICFISFCYAQKITPTVNLFLAIWHLLNRSGDYNKGWWSFSAQNGFKLFEGLPSSNKGWKNRFFVIRTSEKDTLGVNTKWSHPNSAANLLSTLSSEEAKSLDDLVAAAKNNLPDFRILLSEEALIRAGISSAIIKSKGSKGDVKQHHILSQSGLLTALKRKRAAIDAGRSSRSALPREEPILVEEDQEDQPHTKRPKEPQQSTNEIDLLQPTELTNQPVEIPSPLASNDLSHKVMPQQASHQSSIRRIAGASASTVTSTCSGNTTGYLSPSNSKVACTGSVEFRRKQSVLTHPALARELIGQMALPHDCVPVAQKDNLDMAQKLMCQAMEMSQKLIKMDREINTLKGENNALRAKLQSEKMARKATVKLQSLSEEQAQSLETEVDQLKIKLKQVEDRAESAARKVAVAEEKLHQSELAKSRVVAEETLNNFKASREFQDVVEEYHAEAFGLGKCFKLNEFSNDEENVGSFEGREFDLNDSSIVIEITSSANEALDFLISMEENERDNENSVELEFEPFVGQCFLSEEEAFAFYQNYAKRNGFSIRRSRTDKKHGELRKRDFVCRRSGRPPLKVVNVFKKQRNRKSAKCECRAHLRISLRRSFDDIPLEWQVTQFVSSHNHPLLSSSQVGSLPNNRIADDDDDVQSQINEETPQGKRGKCLEQNAFSNDEDYVGSFEGREFYLNVSSKVIDITSSPKEALEFLVSTEENEQDDGNSVEMEFEPFVGQCFLSEEEAFAFYRNYAKRNGFLIRKSRADRKHGELTKRDFVCRRHGRPPLKVFEACKKQRNRKSAKCGCPAHLSISLRKSFDIFPIEWQVTTFVSSHNHPLLSPSQVCLLPTNQISDDERILLLKEAGLSITQVERVMKLEKNVKCGYLSFLKKDIQNSFYKIQRQNVENDAIDLYRCCRIEKEKNPKFKYAFTLNEKRKLEHIFWSPIPCFDWYQQYGDVVVFDASYKVNAYEMPFGIFVGVNNHGKTIPFGCALLQNETASAFQWLMKTFISLMRKSPKSILTNLDPCITEAIAKEMPFTKHSFCIWHITSNFSGWFTEVLRNQYAEWCSDFYKLYKLDTSEEFEFKWHQVVEKHGLQGNKHMNGLYGIRHFWVHSYLCEYFFGGMTTTARSESINAFIKRFISSETSLKDFVKQVDIAIEDIEQTQSHDTNSETYKSSLRMTSPLEVQAHSILTPYAFKLFQKELGQAPQYAILHENGCEFLVQYCMETSSTRMRLVFWDGNLATCTCKKFEFLGILCQHILSVFLHKDCYEIPSMYLPSRWRQEALQMEKIPDVFEEHVLNEDYLLESNNKKISACKKEPQNALVLFERFENSTLLVENASESTVSWSNNTLPIFLSGEACIFSVKPESMAILETNQLNIEPSLVNYFPNYPSPDPIWCGSFEILNSVSRSEFFDGFQAHPPGRVWHKALQFSKQMPGVLLCSLLPSSDVWMDVFHNECPKMEDVSLYFFAGSFERSKQQYIRLLGQIEAQDLVLKSCIDDVELLIFSSTRLHAESCGLALNFLCGVYRPLRSSMVFPQLPFNDHKFQECTQNFDIETNGKKYLSKVKKEQFDGLDVAPRFSKNATASAGAALQSKETSYQV
ncbi:hypothetical protein PTKIN_Ptkin05aG0179100 [Pterospermum kingtungense]